MNPVEPLIDKKPVDEKTLNFVYEKLVSVTNDLQLVQTIIGKIDQIHGFQTKNPVQRFALCLWKENFNLQQGSYEEDTKDCTEGAIQTLSNAFGVEWEDQELNLTIAAFTLLVRQVLKPELDIMNNPELRLKLAQLPVEEKLLMKRYFGHHE